MTNAFILLCSQPAYDEKRLLKNLKEAKIPYVNENGIYLLYGIYNVAVEFDIPVDENSSVARKTQIEDHLVEIRHYILTNVEGVHPKIDTHLPLVVAKSEPDRE